MLNTVNAFILAAGLGERLRPVTDHIPKPLLPILGKPILQSVLEKVSTLPLSDIGINTYHKKESIEDWVRRSSFHDAVTLFPEDPILGTGGALKNAESFLRDNTFIVLNADIFSDIDLEKLVDFHLSSGNLATLAVHNYPEFNNLVIDDNGNLSEIGTMCSLFCPPSSELLAFTGIAVYRPEFLQFLPEGNSSVIHAWIKAASSGQKIGTMDVTGCYWSDIGTPRSYARTVFSELSKNGETVYIHPSVNWCNRIGIDGNIVIEKQEQPPQPPLIKGGIRLKNCIVLPEANFTVFSPPLDKVNHSNPTLDKGGPGGLSFENCILGPGFKIDLKECEILGGDTGGDDILIGTGGSDRQYYRVRKNKGSVVRMQCREDDPDFERQLEYTRFFRKHSIPVPDLVDADTEKMSASFEDLGDLSLYSWLKCPRNQDEIEEIYRKVLDALVLFHTIATRHVYECPLLQQRVFDYDHLRWETRYFLDKFVGGVKNIKAKNSAAIEEELHRLAVTTDSFTKVIVHRDFQSQNIMIMNGGTPRIIDYQGARVGPPAYDVASILWDPYYRLEDEVRDKLLDYYLQQINLPLSHTILSCRLQRHMQALGAYGYLSMVKGKKYFLKHIPEALRLLKEESALTKDGYPELYRLVSVL
jgi:NDP-sugar pyrophosphorylase family protein/aminoglycoside/choline kinase family phosphotransferase